MTTPYIPRSLEPVLRRAALELPAVVLSGPRQSGKTTLLRHLFGGECGYASVELPDAREAALEDPRTFLDLRPPPVIFGEVRNAPALLPYIKERIDRRRGLPGQYLLTGSQNLLLMEGVTETLAGRAAVLRFLPLSRREAEGRPHLPFPWEAPEGEASREPASPGDLWEGFLRGACPELAANPGRDVQLWHPAYVQTYLERDVRSLRQVGDLVPLEVKLSGTPRPAMASSARLLMRDLGERARPGYVVHPGEVRVPLGSGVMALGFGEL